MKQMILFKELSCLAVAAYKVVGIGTWTEVLFGVAAKPSEESS